MAQDPHKPAPTRPDAATPHSAVGTPPTPPPFLPLHTAVVLLTATFIGIILGGLVFLAEKSAPKALLAGLTAAGTSTIALRTLIR